MTKTLKGFASVFYDGTPATEFELSPGVTERVDPLCFARTLRESGDFFALISHDPARPIGRTTSEPPSLYLTVDGRGLLATILPVDGTSDGADALALVASRTLRAMSFAFACIKDEWLPGPNGTTTRLLKDVDLMEVSCVAWPAYKGTTLEVSNAERSLTHALGGYARRVQSLTYEPRHLTHKGNRMIEHADEKRSVGDLMTQSRLRLYDRRARLIAERERASEARQAAITAELADVDRQCRSLAACMN